MKTALTFLATFFPLLFFSSHVGGQEVESERTQLFRIQLKKCLIMKRSNFILATLLSIPAISFAKFGESKSETRPKNGILIRANESRFYGKQKTVKDEIGRCVISSVDSDGDLLIVAPSQNCFVQKGRPPLHIHKFQDEFFFVANGEFLVQLEDEVLELNTGDSVFIPRGTRHTYANPIENNPESIISIHQPAGKTEAFFNYLCTYGIMPDEDLDHDSPIVGPPVNLE